MSVVSFGEFLDKLTEFREFSSTNCFFVGGLSTRELEVVHQRVVVQQRVLTHDGQRIRKDWTVKHFMAGMDFFNRVAEVAEEDGHHPDLHIEGYRNLSIALWTHVIGGLSENDFILAAKIDQLEIALQS